MYFLFSAFLYELKRNNSSLRMARFSSLSFLLPIMRASDFRITSTSLRLLLTSVLPELTMSKIQSARPMPGAISTEPVITWMSAFMPFSSRNLCRMAGYEVAIFLPSNQSSPLYSSALGMASDKRHFEKLRRCTISASSPRSTNSFSPTTPTSAMPVATACGMSSSRRNRTSTGKLGDCISSRRLLVSILMLDSSNIFIVSSCSLPLACTAILSIFYLYN